jgi:hypothetical protein
MARSRSHYEVLGVGPHTSHEEIRRAYRALAQRHHPDANPEGVGDGGESAMAEINAAWEVLGEPERRRTYDLAIGVTPRPRLHFDGVTSDDDDEDDVEHLSDEPFAPVRQRPSDILVAIPVFMAIIVVVTFAFSTLSQNSGMRTAAILMAPVTGGAFVAAPLFVMLRSRSRNDR